MKDQLWLCDVAKNKAQKAEYELPTGDPCKQVYANGKTLEIAMEKAWQVARENMAKSFSEWLHYRPFPNPRFATLRCYAEHAFPHAKEDDLVWVWNHYVPYLRKMYSGQDV